MLDGLNLRPELFLKFGVGLFVSFFDILYGSFRPYLGRFRLGHSVLPEILVTTELLSNVLRRFSQSRGILI